MKGTKHGNWPSLWATRRSSHPEATAATRPPIYKRRNEVERLFRRLKGCATRYDKLDVMAFITLALIHDTLRGTRPRLMWVTSA